MSAPDGLCIQPRTGGPWLGLPSQPWRERKSYWLWREAGRHDERARLAEGWRNGIRPASSAEISQLGRSLAQLGRSVRVQAFGAPGESGQPSESTITGLRVSSGPESCILLPGGAMGDCEPEELDAAGVGSATALGVLCARRAAPWLGSEPCHPLVKSAAECSGWAGPMLCYSGGAGSVQAWDQSRAYLRSWDQLWPVERAPWRLHIRPAWMLIENPTAVGFALVEVDETGPYPSIPAALMGDVWRAPLRGRSVVAVSIWALRELLIPAGLRVVHVLAAVSCATSTGSLGERFREQWADIGAGRKSVYQRVFSGFDPGDRWIGTLVGSGWRWSQQEPDPRARPDLAALGRWSVAGRTAAALHRLGAQGGSAVASHIDCIFEADSGDARPFMLPDILPMDEWSLKAEGPMRCYGPGRYDLAGQSPRMGGPGGSGDSSDEEIYLKARVWAGDPRTDPDSFSEPLDACPDTSYYSYSFGGRVFSGRHGSEQYNDT